MRTRTWIALAASILLVAPAGAAGQTGTGDERVRQAAAALPEPLWEPGPEPVSAAGPGLPEGDAARVATVLVAVLMLAAVGAGYAVGLRRPSAATAPAVPAPAYEPEPEPEPEPAPAMPPPPPPEPAPLPVLDAADASTEECVIALSHAWGRGEFEVRVKDKGGHRVVARSLPFSVPRGMVIKETGAAGRAHRRLLVHLLAAGWQLEPPGSGAWYERRLTRVAGQRGAIDRALVATSQNGGEAEFVALALDEYGNARVMARSPRFRRRAGGPLEETEPAVAAHGTLLGDLEAHGWRVSGTLESWYGATLARRRQRR